MELSVIIPESKPLEIPKWYAIYTRSNFEQKVSDLLRAKEFEVFLPKIQKMKRYRLKRKKVSVPMLPGYVFVHTILDAESYWKIIKTVGVVKIIGKRGKPIPADDIEISSLMILDGTDRTVQNRKLMKRGDLVMIMEGPLKGLIGRYIRHKGKSNKVAVNIELLNRSLVVEIEDWALEKIG